MTTDPTTTATARWVKSSYSGGANGNCVEVADLGAAVGVRDSKNPTGPSLTVTSIAWAKFVTKIS